MTHPPRTLTAEEARKEIWRDLMRARKNAKRSPNRPFFVSDNHIGQIQYKLNGWLKNTYDGCGYHAFSSCHAMTTSNTLHITTISSGCKSNKFKTTPCICYHRMGPDKFIRSEHLPYAKDSECRKGGENGR